MSFFEMEPPKHLDDRILNATDKALAENKRKHFRKMLLNWFAIPVGALAGFALFFKVTQEPQEDVQVAEFSDWNEVELEEQEIIADLEIIEDLEILEKWEES